jgi:hypothetical protein
MNESVVLKLIRPYRGQGPGELVAVPETAAASLVRKGIAVPASADLIALYRPKRHAAVETAMAADAPEIAITRRGKRG